MFEKLPIEIYYKLINYGIYEPTHYIAFKTAKIRPIFSNELNCNISGVITLNETIQDDLNEEWEYFLTNYHHLHQYPLNYPL